MSDDTRTAPRSSDEAVATTGLTKRFGERAAVAGMSLRVPSGRAFGLLGPNGSGKTTTVRLLTGLLTPSEGHVDLLGERLGPANRDALRARIGVQTDTEIYLSLSARENLTVWGELYGIPPGRLPGRIDEVLDLLALASRTDSPAGQLSRGMRQKLSVGRAILHQPELLFLDEPTAGLDPQASADVIAYLRETMRSSRMTVVICTHQLLGLEELCDGVGILVEGRLVAAGDVQQLLVERWPHRRYEIVVHGDLDHAAARLACLTGDADLELVREGNRLRVSVTDDDAITATVADLVRGGVPVSAVLPQRPTIQDLYFATIHEGVHA